MDYIYDILLNYKEEYFEFYDWNKNDNIVHIRKIPIIRICSQDLYNIINNKIKLDISFLELIDNKTELFTNNGIRKIKYACLLSDGEMIISINLVHKKLKISSLLIDEELDSLEDVYRMDINNIQYCIQKENKRDQFKTRKQLEKNNYIKKELTKIINDNKKIQYLYFECFDKKEKNADKIINILMNLEDDKKIDKVFNFFKLIKVNNE